MGADNDRFEQIGMDFHNKVYQGYLELSKKYSDRFIVIDASGERMETHAKIIKQLPAKPSAGSRASTTSSISRLVRKSPRI